jgi:hypothetical protein
MMRTIVDLPDSQLEALKYLEEQHRVSRAELVRQAVAEYVVKRVAGANADAFGAWKTQGKKVDGLTHQRALRREWGDK